jgi:RNA polymerase sigma factor (sigma-70 family)
MQEQTDAQLLRDYVRRGSQAAFREIVARHADLVYSAALRQVESPDLARDVAQSVFIDLARKACSLAEKMPESSSLVGWLYRSTRFAALNQLRADRRRLAHERLAMEQLATNSASGPDWERIRPALDAAMGDLNDEDREALLLRYFRNDDFRAVGRALGVSDDAAQKRVSRAVERLREIFARRGVTVGSGGIVAVIAANAVQAAPIGLAVTISTGALAGMMAATTFATKTTLATMNWINAKSLAALTVSALVAGTGTYFVQQREASRLRSENENLAQIKQKLSVDRDAATAALTAREAELERSRAERAELIRLRGEVGMLRAQSKELERLRENNQKLQAALAEKKPAAPSEEKDSENDPQRQMAIAKLNDARLLALGLVLYADEHQNRYPTDLNQTSNYWNSADHRLTNTNQFDLVIQGSVESVTNAAATIAVRERQPFFSNGKWHKAYGFADGHAEIKSEPAAGFEAWEKERMPPPR